MVIRAGVDDRQMTSALGINIGRTFAIAFFVGSALAAMGGTVGASQGGVSSGQDGLWLLYSLVVVIVGGMGSLVGAAVGSLLVAFVLTFSASYLPSTGDPAGIECCTQYSITLHLCAHRARARLQAAGSLREGRMSRRVWTPRTVVERSLGVVALVDRASGAGDLQ